MRGQEMVFVLVNVQSSALFVRNAFLVSERTLTSAQLIKNKSLNAFFSFLMFLLLVSAKLRRSGAISH